MRSITEALRDRIALAAAVCAVCICALPAHGQFVRPEQPSEQAPAGACDLAFPSKVPVRCWQGQQVFVLPRNLGFREYGYQSIDGGSGYFGHPSYDELAGKTLTVAKVEAVADLLGGPMNDYRLTLTDDATGKRYTTKTVNIGKTPDDARATDMVLLRDLVEAKKRYVGKTYWITVSELPKPSMSDAYGGDGFTVFLKFAPVTITDVLAAPSDYKPVRIVMKNGQGEEGYFDIAASATNALSSASVGDAALETVLAASSPKQARKWPPKVWNAIQHARVFVGMSKEMATMSWGTPSDVNRTLTGRHVHEQWVYDKSYLYFDDGVLSAIQN